MKKRAERNLSIAMPFSLVMAKEKFQLVVYENVEQIA